MHVGNVAAIAIDPPTRKVTLLTSWHVTFDGNSYVPLDLLKSLRNLGPEYVGQTILVVQVLKSGYMAPVLQWKPDDPNA
jgi:hypothetical protein